MDSNSITAFVFNEILPCLVDNASDWFSSCSMVTAKYNEACQKMTLYTSDPNVIYPSAKPIPVNAEASHTPCIQVYVSFVFNEALDYNLEDIHTREDLILLLGQLKSLAKDIFTTAMANYEPAFLAKETMETYSHTRL